MPPAPSARTEDPPAPAAAGPSRWHSLDVLKGLALWAMIAHHLNKWAGGDIDERFVGFDHFIVTDLAAPVFAVALGAAAVVVGSRVDAWRDLRGPVWRWTQILLLGIAIDIATHRGDLEGRGVLPTLALLGLVITLAVAAGVCRPVVWWLATAVCVVVAVPATRLGGDDVLGLLVSGPFALPVYGVFASAGAAVATHGLGRPERELPLLPAVGGVLAAGLVAATLAGGVVAPEGTWPPARYPGHLGFTLWGLVASLAIWAIVRSVLPAGGRLSEAAARAGRRTLSVFGSHFLVKVALQRADLIGELDTRRWGIVVWLVVIGLGAASALPARQAVTTRRIART